jgi:hypothetical protein
MRYFLDCEFNGHGGELISMALLSEYYDCHDLYMVFPEPKVVEPWVHANVMPILLSVPPFIKPIVVANKVSAAGFIRDLLRKDWSPVVVVDWPADIRYFCDVLEIAPGQMISTGPVLKFELHRVDAYPTKVRDAIQHNAWWDACALRYKITHPDE